MGRAHQTTAYSCRRLSCLAYINVPLSTDWDIPGKDAIFYAIFSSDGTIPDPVRPNFFRLPFTRAMRCWSQERVQLLTSNLAGHSHGPSEQKPNKTFGKKERGRIQKLSKFLGTPIISGTC